MSTKSAIRIIIFCIPFVFMFLPKFITDLRILRDAEIFTFSVSIYVTSRDLGGLIILSA